MAKLTQEDISRISEEWEAAHASGKPVSLIAGHVGNEMQVTSVATSEVTGETITPREAEFAALQFELSKIQKGGPQTVSAAKQGGKLALDTNLPEAPKVLSKLEVAANERKVLGFIQAQLNLHPEIDINNPDTAQKIIDSIQFFQQMGASDITWEVSLEQIQRTLKRLNNK